MAAFSIVVGTAVLALKVAAWAVTGSAALYSDALESIVNIAASALALFALWVAEKPADAKHPYGHDKAEFFAAVVEGALIIVAALSIMHAAWTAWHAPTVLDAPWSGLALNAAATGINAIWALVLGRSATRHRSAALDADARHLWGDVVTSSAIMAGVVLVVVTGYARLDPLLAAAAAIWVLVSGLRLLWRSIGTLMDEAPEPAVTDRVRALVAAHAEGALEAHDLRMRHAGRQTFLEFHLVVPGEMRVDDSHVICDRIETALRAEVQGLLVTIHVEPEMKAKHQGVLVL